MRSLRLLLSHNFLMSFNYIRYNIIAYALNIYYLDAFYSTLKQYILKYFSTKILQKTLKIFGFEFVYQFSKIKPELLLSMIISCSSEISLEFLIKVLDCITEF